jgi:hypothetical protein
VLRVGEYSDRGAEKAFDYGSRNAVPLAFFPVPAVPIKPDHRWDHAVRMCFSTYKRQSTVCPYQVSSRVLTNSPISIPPPLFLGDGSREHPT